jgi:hypothetical protein
MDKIGLTPPQRDFMGAFHRAIYSSKGPLSVGQIREIFKKSDSRIRSHLKALIAKGYILCVGKSKVKKYVPSMLWVEEIDNDESFDEMELPCAGGYCETPGCNALAEDSWGSGYYCRKCIIGHDDASDLADIRASMEERCGVQSSAGQLLDAVPWVSTDGNH